MKKAFLLLLLLAFGCNSDDENSEVFIRISNVSAYNFQNITVNTWNNPLNYEDLGSGELSAYQMVTKAYRYAFVELEIDGETYTIQPIDFVGETPLKNGHYTYEIDADISTQQQYGALSIVLVED